MVLDQETAYRDQVRAWHEEHATPRGETSIWDVQDQSEEAMAERFAAGQAWQRKLAEAGYAGITIPTEYGGQGGAGWMVRIFNEVSLDYEESPGFIGSTIAMLAPTLLRHGNEEQKRHHIPRLLNADDTFCQLFSEPTAGSDLAGLGCRAGRDGDEFVVNGQKVWNSSAQYCDWGFLLARTDPDVPKHQGISFFLLSMSTPGVEVRPLIQANGSAHFNEVFLTDVRIPATNVVGEVDGGWGPARTVLQNESAFIGSARGSASQRLIELARIHDRIEDPVVRQGLADAYTRDRVLELLGGDVLAAVREGRAPRFDPGLLKLAAVELKVRSGNLAMSIAGPAGLTSDRHAEQWARSEVINRFGISIGGGTNEVLRNNVGERALGLPREPRVDKDVAWKDVPK